MNIKPIQHWNSLNSAFKALVVLLLMLGIFFRFASLAERPYWHDETYTLLRVSGYTIADITTQLFNGQLIDRSELLKFQQIAPEKTWLDMIRSLITEEPHRAPLYYTIVQGWMRWFGSDVIVMRSLSALISLLVFPALYWLCVELFMQPFTGWIAILLMAVSPFHVYYAQEVREYSLWTVTILLMSAALLRAIRVQTKAAWSVYSITIISSLYTLILSAPLVASHLIYVLQTQKKRAFLKALLLSESIALPWLSFTLINYSQVKLMSAWMFQPIPIQELLRHWLTNFQFVFLTENLTGRLNWLFASAIVLLVTLAIKSLIQHSPKAVWGFVVLLTLPLFLSVAIPDLVWGGLRSTNSRYFVPSYLGIQLAVAHWFATQIQLQTRLQQTYWKFVLFAVLTAGVLSCSVQVFQNQMSEDKVMASLINRSQSAIVISNEVSYQGGGTIGDILALSHLVHSKTQFQLVIQPQVPLIPNQLNIYLYKPLTYLKQELQQSYQLQAIYKDKLFRLLPNPK
ncbi:MAG: hypothetical protein KME10_10545 [Plectolyngbya sp. WJT66-NPBG17]|jgi:uncharacterized membrane protein|nr:hypothetical protein [Plectolyngbya sp. WJT66-NPBG17]